MVEPDFLIYRGSGSEVRIEQMTILSVGKELGVERWVHLTHPFRPIRFESKLPTEMKGTV